MKKTVLLLMIAMLSGLNAAAQKRMHVNKHEWDTQWSFPIVVDSVDEVIVNDAINTLQVYTSGDFIVPFAIETIDSVTFEDDPLIETKNPYEVFQLYIVTEDGWDITSKDYYTRCHLSLNGKGAFSNLSLNGQIRGRGNSSFLWYDKKPYRIKLDNKHKILGVDKAKSWVLLANYRDVTDLMNTFVFEMGHYLGLPYTNHTRYVEVFLNEDYKGLYQLTEQIQQNKNRVAVSKERGILISLDVDDGPSESPWAGDNFWSEVYNMPVCVKYPDEEYATAYTIDSVKTELARLERTIKSKNYSEIEKLIDIPSLIKYLQIQEFVLNVELCAPRSVYMHKDGDGKWVMGPLWDFDAGYDFDWSSMYTGHNYFTAFTELVMGSDPLNRKGMYGNVPRFFTDIFGCKEFVKAYKAQWATVKGEILTHCWDECMKYVEQLRASGALTREFKRWPIKGKNFDTELEKMHKWLENRLIHISYVIAAIPEPK